MPHLRRLVAHMLALLLLRLIWILRPLVRALRLQGQEGPGWRRMIRARMAFPLMRLSHALLNLSGLIARWLAE
jgi:hypothetical protein